jgi:hypothetical protein
MQVKRTKSWAHFKQSLDAIIRMPAKEAMPRHFGACVAAGA